MRLSELFLRIRNYIWFRLITSNDLIYIYIIYTCIFTYAVNRIAIWIETDTLYCNKEKVICVCMGETTKHMAFNDDAD